MKNLFKDPLQQGEVGADFKSAIGSDKTAPNSDAKSKDKNAAFGFFVMTSPTELQVSIDKKSGSHWEVFDCKEPEKDQQTIKMFCNHDADVTNCGDVHRGHGVPGTILEIPKGCGKGRYGVAVGIAKSADQNIPKSIKIRKRDGAPPPIVYDMKFDYDFSRVPRDSVHGKTQWRLDYSNVGGYWDKIVASPGHAASRLKGKRSFQVSLCPQFLRKCNLTG